MKKTGIKLLVILFLLTAVMPATIAHAYDLSVGGATWYSWWEIDTVKGGEDGDDSALLYGPLFSFSFSDKWSVSGVFLYGHYEFQFPSDSKEDVYRFDSDLVLNYRVASLVKVFAGAKIMGYKWKLSTLSGTDDGLSYNVGPAIGVGFTIPLTTSLYALANVSGLYARGKNTVNSDTGNDKESLSSAYGGNGTLTLAWYIASASTSINLGGRYQYFYLMHDNSESFEYEAHNHIYGVTLSAVYTFDL